MAVDNQSYEKYKSKLVEAVLSSDIVQKQLKVVLANIARSSLDSDIPESIKEIVRNIAEEAIEIVLNNGVFKVDLQNPTFKQDLADKACEMSRADEVLTIQTPLSQKTRQLRKQLDDLRKEQINIPEWIVQYHIGSLVSFVTQAAILAIQNIDPRVMLFTPEETVQAQAEFLRIFKEKGGKTEIIDPSKDSPENVIAEIQQRLDEEKKKQN